MSLKKITGSQLYKNEIHKFIGLGGENLMRLFLLQIWINVNFKSQTLEMGK